MPPRFWPAAGLLGLLAPAAGLGNHHPPACPPAPCATPTKVVVECPPPEITFKHAAPACVRAPGPAGCAPGVQCYPFSLPQAGPTFAPPMLMTAPQMMTAPAPQMMMMAAPAPQMMMMAAPAPQMMMAPQMMAAPAPQMMMAAPQMMAPQMMAGPAPMAAPAPGPMAAPGCGGAGPGGLGGLSAADLRALADHHEGLEQMGLRLQAADLARRYRALAAHPAAAAAGLAPFPAAAPKGAADPPPVPPGAALAPAPDAVLDQIRDVRAEVAKLQALVIDHTEILKQHNTLILIHNRAVGSLAKQPGPTPPRTDPATPPVVPVPTPSALPPPTPVTVPTLPPAPRAVPAPPADRPGGGR